ncbi:single stranded DNA-binding domain-containing protein, partial [Staphylococcus epidermidis]
TNAQREPQPDFINSLLFPTQAQNLNNYFSKPTLPPLHPPIQSPTYQNQQPPPIFLTQLLSHTLHFLQPKNPQHPP